MGAALNIALFPVLSVHLKTRAPGAKTFLQVNCFVLFILIRHLPCDFSLVILVTGLRALYIGQNTANQRWFPMIEKKILSLHNKGLLYCYYVYNT